MRSFWSQVPLFRITLAIITGVGTELFADWSLALSATLVYPVCILFVLSLIAVSILALLRSTEVVYRFRLLNGVSISLFLISLGYLIAWFNTERNYPAHFKNFLDPESTVVAKITRPPLEKEKTIRMVGEVTKVINGNRVISVKGHLLINIPRSYESESITYGDLVIFKSTVMDLEDPKNPEEFNYRRYQYFHNACQRVYLKKGEWKIGAHNQGNSLMANVYRLRAYFLSIITRYVPEKNDFAVASAIMLGYNDYLSGEISRAYATSGTLHVLSVSGLHVGIMFIMLNFLLKAFDKFGRKFQIGKAIFIILFIWFYACLTGLSPSVLRSALMFSIIQLGMLMIRNVNMYNVIAGSALLLILFNPFIITEVGFMLSYIAVVGIVYLYPKIYPLVTIGNGAKPKFKNEPNWLLKPATFFRNDLVWFLCFALDWVWKLIAVSIAAQLATMPLSLFYFNQFPNLFLLSNLLVIPLSNLILFAGTGLFFIAQVPYLSGWVGWFFNALLVALNKFIFFIDAVPFSLIQGISISAAEMLLIYLVIVLLCWLTLAPRVKVLFAVLLILFGLSFFYVLETVHECNQKSIVVYSVPKQSAIAFIQGQRSLQAFDTSLLNNEGSMLFSVRHHWWACGVKQVDTIAWNATAIGKVAQFAGKRILVVDSTFFSKELRADRKLKVDIVILAHNPKTSIKTIANVVRFDELVFDSSNKPRQLAKWKAECVDLNQKYHDVAERGAYLKELRAGIL